MLRLLTFILVLLAILVVSRKVSQTRTNNRLRQANGRNTPRDLSQRYPYRTFIPVVIVGTTLRRP